MHLVDGEELTFEGDQSPHFKKKFELSGLGDKIPSEALELGSRIRMDKITSGSEEYLRIFRIYEHINVIRNAILGLVEYHKIDCGNVSTESSRELVRLFIPTDFSDKISADEHISERLKKESFSHITMINSTAYLRLCPVRKDKNKPYDISNLDIKMTRDRVIYIMAKLHKHKMSPRFYEAETSPDLNKSFEETEKIGMGLSYRHTI